MKKTETLKQKFQNEKVIFGEDILNIMSTKTDDGRVFPPYFPFIGENYDEFKILTYATAQNIKYDWFRNLYTNNFDKLTERLYYFDNFQKKYPDNKISYQDIAINPYQTGIIPALIGVFLYAKFGKKIEDLDEINNLIGISNYYKFSLNNGNNDINPEPTGKNPITKYIKDKDQIENYWKVNDGLVKNEIETLKPKFILSFKGRKLNKLNEISENEIEIIEINDPSWILNGAGGHLSENGSWWKKAMSCKETVINELIDHYLDNINGNYKGKKNAIKIYLLKYYLDWKN